MPTNRTLNFFPKVPLNLKRAYRTIKKTFDFIKKTTQAILIYEKIKKHPTLQPKELLKARIASLLHPERISIAWVLCGDENVGSSRIHGINLHNHLKNNSIDSFIINKPKNYNQMLAIDHFAFDAITSCNFDFVIFQRVHQGDATKLINILNTRGTTTVFIIADLYETEALRATKLVITVSDSLKDKVVEQGIDRNKIHTLPDAIETKIDLHKDYSNPHQNPINIVWVGAEGHWHSLQQLRNILANDIRFGNFILKTISNHPAADIEWNIGTVWEQIMRCDIGVIPVDLNDPKSIIKSNNRATMFKALGLPIICSPLPAYKLVIDNGNTGYLAESTDEWCEALILLSEIENRKKIGLAGREEIFEQYGIEAVGTTLINLLFTTLPPPSNQTTDYNTTGLHTRRTCEF